ncbi:hypothetical protein Emed_005124 [Eimeria media]
MTRAQPWGPPHLCLPTQQLHACPQRALEFPVPKVKQQTSPARETATAAAAAAAAAATGATATAAGVDGVPVMRYDGLFAFADDAQDEWEAVRRLPRARPKKETGVSSSGEAPVATAADDSRSRRLAMLQALPKPEGGSSACLGAAGSSSAAVELNLGVKGEAATAAAADEDADAAAAGDAALQLMMPRVLQQKRQREAKSSSDGPSLGAKGEADDKQQQEQQQNAEAPAAAEAAETGGDGVLTGMFTLYESDEEEEATQEAPSSSSSSSSSGDASSSSSSGSSSSSSSYVKTETPYDQKAAEASAADPAAAAAATAAAADRKAGCAWESRGEAEVLDELGIDKSLLQNSGLSLTELRELRRMGITSVSGATLQNPDWHLAAESGPQAKKAKLRLATKVWSAKDGAITETLEPKQMQKRKHQINWLAAEAHEKELEMLEMTARTRQTKYQTAMKYGW